MTELTPHEIMVALNRLRAIGGNQEALEVLERIGQTYAARVGGFQADIDALKGEAARVKELEARLALERELVSAATDKRYAAEARVKVLERENAKLRVAMQVKLDEYLKALREFGRPAEARVQELERENERLRQALDEECRARDRERSR